MSPRQRKKTEWSLFTSAMDSPSMEYGQLVVLEGPDGVGKSTLSGLLAEQLRGNGISCQTYAFPGNEPGTLGSFIYQLHHDRSTIGIKEIAPLALQASHIAAHLDAIERILQPRMKCGENVILDRFWWSTWVYGHMAGVSLEVLNCLIEAERRCWGRLQPLVIFLIESDHPWRSDVDVQTWDGIVQGYRTLANIEQFHTFVKVIRNKMDPQYVIREMTSIVLEQIRDNKKFFRSYQLDRLQMGLDFVSREWTNGGASTITLTFGSQLKPTKVFETYWHFAAERQEIFFRRLEGSPPPWSDDPILQKHRFTNAYRASDRVSQYLIRNVQYSGSQQPEDLFFRTILFKLFNRIETWELLEKAFGEIHASEFRPFRFEKVLDGLRRAGNKIYSPAYIMPAAPGGQGQAKHAGHLRLLEKMLRDDLPKRLLDANSLQQAFTLLRAYPMMGDFLAFQYVIDLNYSTLINFSEMDFVVPGQGAMRGMHKCFLNMDGMQPKDIIQYVTDRQEIEFTDRGLLFRNLWGRPLQLIDCQNLFCEVDKYARVAHPEMNERGGRTRIKQLFHPGGNLITPWYPPKWNINENIRNYKGVDGDTH